MYEILAFEHNSMYDIQHAEAPEEALKLFVEMCCMFVRPEYVEKNQTSFDSGHLYMSYADHSGNDKPMLIMLVGNITDEMVSDARAALDKLYVVICEDCNKNEIPITKSVCSECENN